MRNGTLWSTAAVITLIVWSGVASSLWCYWAGTCRPGEWWLLQWWFVLPYWRENWYVTVLVICSATAASAVAALGLFALWVIRRPNTRQPKVWGSSDFADRHEMDRGGIKTREKLF